jgi:2-phosphosulfolactate phosphatase
MDRIRLEWGPAGAAAIASGAEVLAVVDVLSFTTTLTVAVERGIRVLPFRWGAAEAAEEARRHDATLAIGRSRAVGPGQVSLSPGTILRSTGLSRLVLPSPNGSAISALLAGAGVPVIGVSLRNAAAAAAWVGDRSVSVIAAGERWPDGSLRPAIEDFWGAGAFVSALISRRGPAGCSVEARSAAVAYESLEDLDLALSGCGSGRELIGLGFAADVAVAAAAGASSAVPVLVDGWYVADSCT